MWSPRCRRLHAYCQLLPLWVLPKRKFERFSRFNWAMGRESRRIFNCTPYRAISWCIYRWLKGDIPIFVHGSWIAAVIRNPVIDLVAKMGTDIPDWRFVTGCGYSGGEDTQRWIWCWPPILIDPITNTSSASFREDKSNVWNFLWLLSILFIIFNSSLSFVQDTYIMRPFEEGYGLFVPTK